MTSVRNVAGHSAQIEFQMSSPLLVLTDPLVLHELRGDLDSLSSSDIEAEPPLIRRIPRYMCIGLQEIRNFVPGSYSLTNDDVETSTDEADPRTFDIDTGTLVAVDFRYLPQLSRILDWDRYDQILQLPANDDSGWIEVIRELGGPFFGILWGDIKTPFKGDGRYRIRDHAPTLKAD